MRGGHRGPSCNNQCHTPSYCKTVSWTLHRDYLTAALCAIYGLPIHERIRFKLARLMYKAFQNHLPFFTCLLWSTHAALLQAATFSVQYLLESIAFLASALSLVIYCRWSLHMEGPAC